MKSGMDINDVRGSPCGSR